MKVANHPHTIMISKPVIVTGGENQCGKFEMPLKLSDEQHKTITYLYRLLYKKSVIPIHRKMKQNPNTTLKIVITL